MKKTVAHVALLTATLACICSAGMGMSAGGGQPSDPSAESPSMHRGRDRIYLPAVSSLFFTVGQYTASRRDLPRPQLNCRIGCEEAEREPTRVDCFNQGLEVEAGPESSSDVDWMCHASPPVHGYDIANEVISCEGYAYPGDAYVLRGSCYLTYDLVKVDDANEGESNGAGDEETEADDTNSEDAADEGAFGFGAWVMVVVVVAVVAVVAKKVANRVRGTDAPNGYSSIV